MCINYLKQAYAYGSYQYLICTLVMHAVCVADGNNPVELMVYHY